MDTSPSDESLRTSGEKWMYFIDVNPLIKHTDIFEAAVSITDA